MRGLTVVAERVVHRARAEDVEHTPVGERDVHLHVVRVPLVGQRFDADARQAELGAVVPDPHVDRLPHLRIGRLRREHELAVVVQAAGQIDAHPRILRLRGWSRSARA